jgi:hypothetical protein
MPFYQVVFANGCKAGIDAENRDAAERQVKKVFKKHIKDSPVVEIREIKVRD